MPRKINSNLIDRLLNKNDLKPILDIIKKPNSKLRLEIRHGNVDVYYRKGLFFKIKPKLGVVNGAKKYNLPSSDISKKNPSEYIKKGIEAIDIWLKKNKKRKEFDSQQNIAICNQKMNNKYIILDMEYSFERASRTEKLISIDLVGVERLSGKIVLFEVKTGLGAINNKSGIDEHIYDYEKYINGPNKERYRKNLLNDVKSILSNKMELQLISDKSLLSKVVDNTPEFKFIFHPESTPEIEIFKNKLNNKKELILVNDNDYTLY